MATNCTPSSLLAAAECFDCALTHKQLLASLVYVLCQINGMSCTPASLSKAAECFRCALTEKQLIASLVYLVCNGSTAIGGGAVGQIIIYTAVNPTIQGLVPANINAPAIAYSATGVNSTYTWNTTSHTWQ